MNEKIFSTKILAVLFAGLLGIGATEGYYSYKLGGRMEQAEHSLKTLVDSQRETIAKLAVRVDEAEARSADMEKEVATTRERLGSTRDELQKTRQTAVQLSKQQTRIRHEQEATKGTVGALTTDVSGVKEKLASTQNDVASTRNDLQHVVGDLGVQSDLIAHNRSELEELKLLGQRDYYEFDLRKSKQPQRVGHLSMALRKADAKRQKYTVNLIADDRTIEKKDKTANEPVQFYQPGYRQPTEIVVNQVYKDHVVGYVSVPKKKDQRAVSNPATAETAKGSS